MDESTRYLVVETDGSDKGRRIELTGARLTVGRLPSCDLRFDDPRVSRMHAALWQREGADYVEDLGSVAGTFVNGEAIGSPRRLHPGDRVSFVVVQLRYRTGDKPSDLVSPVRYDISDQQGQSINNVGRDQYHSHRYVIEQRQSFLREIAASRSWARGLVWTGVTAFLVGLITAVVGVFLSLGPLIEGITAFINMTPKEARSALPAALKKLGGFPVLAVGVVINAFGLPLIIIGILLHIVATARRKQVDRELPPPPTGPWGESI